MESFSDEQRLQRQSQKPGNQQSMSGLRFIKLFSLLSVIKNENKSACLADKTRKEVYKVFEQLDLKITAEAHLHAVNILFVTFDLTT